MKDTPLLRAAHNGHLQTVMYLAEQGADLNTVDLVRSLEGAEACAHSWRGLDPPAPLLQGDNTALHWAAMRGHVEIVNFLLQKGADKNIRNKQDFLPVRLGTGARVCMHAVSPHSARCDAQANARATQIDMAKPVWSVSWRYTQEVLSA
jgi:ankyrin repeat protein